MIRAVMDAALRSRCLLRRAELLPPMGLPLPLPLLLALRSLPLLLPLLVQVIRRGPAGDGTVTVGWALAGGAPFSKKSMRSSLSSRRTPPLERIPMVLEGVGCLPVAPCAAISRLRRRGAPRETRSCTPVVSCVCVVARRRPVLSLVGTISTHQARSLWLSASFRTLLMVAKFADFQYLRSNLVLYSRHVAKSRRIKTQR